MIETRNVLKPVLVALALAGVLGFSGVAGAQQYYGGGQGGYGPGWTMGPGMMGGWMGPGMMGGRMGPGMRGGWMEPGMRGYGPCGYGPGWMMGPGMMGYGYGRGGYYHRPPPAKLDLSVEQVKRYLQHWVDVSGNPHLKVGSVVAKNASTIIAEIVSDKGAPVERLSVNRQTGRYEPIALK